MGSHHKTACMEVEPDIPLLLCDHPKPTVDNYCNTYSLSITYFPDCWHHSPDVMQVCLGPSQDHTSHDAFYTAQMKIDFKVGLTLVI